MRFFSQSYFHGNFESGGFSSSQRGLTDADLMGSELGGSTNGRLQNNTSTDNYANSQMCRYLVARAIVVTTLFLGTVVALWLCLERGTPGIIGGVCLAVVLLILVCFMITHRVCDGLFQHMDNDESRLLSAQEESVEAGGNKGMSVGWERNRLVSPLRVGAAEEGSYGAVGL